MLSQPVIPTCWRTATRKNNRLDFCRKKGKICSIAHAAACLNISTIIYCSNKLNHFSTNMTGQYKNTPPIHRKYCNREKTNMARCELYVQGQQFGLGRLFGFCPTEHRSPTSKPSNQKQEFHALRETSLYSWELFFPYKTTPCCNNLGVSQSRNVIPHWNLTGSCI